MLAAGGLLVQGQSERQAPSSATRPSAGEDRRTPNQLVEQEVLPQIDFLFRTIVREQRETTLDGQRAFTGGDPFLPGKIALGLSYLLVKTPRADPRFAGYLAGYRDIADLTIADQNDTWGIYYYTSALNKLREAGLLGDAVRPATLEKLRRQLDWRRFVRVPEMTLIDHPTNYLGVAFSIARLRMLLGWEDAAASEQLLKKIVEHYQAFSGEYGFSDETDGAGRFDRYSVLLIAEICERLLETHMQATPQLEAWLRKSADVVLVNLNEDGDGFSYGRSIGVYGDTAFMEVLAAAAYYGVLTPVEKEMAYAFHTRAMRKYVDFWYDPEMHSVNMWEKGRATDGYRNKSRILGENFSLIEQLIKTTEVWNALGYRDKAPDAGFGSWLKGLPGLTLTWFARGSDDRALVTYRDGAHVFSLPVINGGPRYHARNAYFPIPYSRGVVEGSPDADYPLLLPRFTLTDGATLQPLAFMTDVRLDQGVVTYRHPQVDRVEEDAPLADDRLAADVRYELAPGRIGRRDTYRPARPLAVKQIALEFASFSTGVERVGEGRFAFASGDVHEVQIEGLHACTARPLDGSAPYRAPHGAMRTLVSCTTDNVTLDKPFTIAWTLRYR